MRDQRIIQKHHESFGDSYALAEHLRTLGGANYFISTRNRSFNASLPAVILSSGSAHDLLIMGVTVVIGHIHSFCDNVGGTMKIVQISPIISILANYHTCQEWSTASWPNETFRISIINKEKSNGTPQPIIRRELSLVTISKGARSPPQSICSIVDNRILFKPKLYLYEND